LWRARDLARVDLAASESDLEQGLIHADLLTENVMVDGTHLAFIDFDDGAFGFATLSWQPFC